MNIKERSDCDGIEQSSNQQQTEQRQSKMERVLQQLQDGVMAVYTSDKYIDYLRFMTKFHNYSVNNQILIYTHMPEATLVAGYHKWNDMGRHVKRGEKAVPIISPCVYKKEVDDTNADGSYKYDSGGNKLKKEVEVQGYKACSVFDVSQTEGDPLPEYISDLKDPVADYFNYLTAIESASPVPIRFGDEMGEGVHGYYSPVKQEIVIRRGMSEMQTLKTACHEIAHARLNHGSKEDQTDKQTKEIQAESTAFVVCDALGLDTSDYSFSYIAGFSSGKDVKELKASLDVIRQESSKMIQEITQKLEMSMHRNIQVEGPKMEGHRMRMAM